MFGSQWDLCAASPTKAEHATGVRSAKKVSFLAHFSASKHMRGMDRSEGTTEGKKGNIGADEIYISNQLDGAL